MFFSNSLCSTIIIKQSNLLTRFTLQRTFIDARIKWMRDPFLDFTVSREINLRHCCSLKNLILSSSSLSLPISVASLHKPHLNFPSNTTSLYFFQRYPSLFTLSPPLVKLTPQFITLHREEQEIHDSSSQKESAVYRLCKLNPSKIGDVGVDNCVDFEVGLELIKCRKELGVPAILNKEFGDYLECREGKIVKFPMKFSPGFDLQKKVKDWIDAWQCLPYISPYEDAFHIAPRSDQAEKWTVAVIHEILSLLVSKKTEMRNILRLGDYLGFGLRFKKAIVHHPGIFYVSNKNKTQTVILREAFVKDRLLENHPLVGMRHRYIYLMNKSRKGRRKLVKALNPGYSLKMSTSYSDEGVKCVSEE
ncbi:protein WHAT'S THIS FACTOR 9, mitochondrial isoform X2 [Spinacia oleracea]|uniref:Protein WHAT'S THIS FACTOR 9, mitochondrial isoform X2 n=1 Tax=Spinacia oleracea TaxID=3562 RepID=A0ABM3R1T0_SPIOL|nr:protein WHAT'S THIS FACTOR 9, mitochondrial isoform X2 [Spinacia oleracea]